MESSERKYASNEAAPELDSHRRNHYPPADEDDEKSIRIDELLLAKELLRVQIPKSWARTTFSTIQDSLQDHEPSLDPFDGSGKSGDIQIISADGHHHNPEDNGNHSTSNSNPNSRPREGKAGQSGKQQYGGSSRGRKPKKKIISHEFSQQQPQSPLPTTRESRKNSVLESIRTLNGIDPDLGHSWVDAAALAVAAEQAAAASKIPRKSWDSSTIPPKRKDPTSVTAPGKNFKGLDPATAFTLNLTAVRQEVAGAKLGSPAAALFLAQKHKEIEYTQVTAAAAAAPIFSPKRLQQGTLSSGAGTSATNSLNSTNNSVLSNNSKKMIKHNYNANNTNNNKNSASAQGKSSIERREALNSGESGGLKKGRKNGQNFNNHIPNDNNNAKTKENPQTTDEILSSTSEKLNLLSQQTLRKKSSPGEKSLEKEGEMEIGHPKTKKSSKESSNKKNSRSPSTKSKSSNKSSKSKVKSKTNDDNNLNASVSKIPKFGKEGTSNKKDDLQNSESAKIEDGLEISKNGDNPEDPANSSIKNEKDNFLSMNSENETAEMREDEKSADFGDAPDPATVNKTEPSSSPLPNLFCEVGSIPTSLTQVIENFEKNNESVLEANERDLDDTASIRTEDAFSTYQETLDDEETVQGPNVETKGQVKQSVLESGDDSPKTLSQLNTTIKHPLEGPSVSMTILPGTPPLSFSGLSLVITKNSFRRTNWEKPFESLTLTDVLHGITYDNLHWCKRTLRSVKFCNIASLRNILTIIQSCPNIQRLSFLNIAVVEKKLVDKGGQTPIIHLPQLRELEFIEFKLSLNKYEYWLLDFFTRFVNFSRLDSFIFRGRDFFHSGENKEVYHRRLDNLINPSVVAQFLMKNRASLQMVNVGGVGFQLYDRRDPGGSNLSHLYGVQLSFLRVDLNTEGIDLIMSSQHKLHHLSCAGFISTLDNRMKNSLMRCFEKNLTSLQSIGIFPCIVTSVSVPSLFQNLYNLNLSCFEQFTQLETLFINITAVSSRVFTHRFPCGRFQNIHLLPTCLVKIELYTSEFKPLEVIALGKRISKFRRLTHVVLSSLSSHPYFITIHWIHGLLDLPDFTRADFFGGKWDPSDGSEQFLTSKLPNNFLSSIAEGRISLEKVENSDLPEVDEDYDKIQENDDDLIEPENIDQYSRINS